jgi:hypothetical protein
MAKRPYKRKRKGRRSRLKTAGDSQTQLQQISSAQKAARQRKITIAIDSIEKSKQRFLNSLRRIKDADDAYREFE